MDTGPLARALRDVNSVPTFEHWARVSLRRFVPHEMSMFGLAVRHALGFAIENVVNVNLPSQYLRSISGPAGALTCPVLYDWFRTREPQFFEAEGECDTQVDATWLATFRAFEL